MSLVSVRCGYCGCVARKEAGGVNRARRGGYALYCSRECSGKGRRLGKSVSEKKAEKAAYDLARRNGPLRQAILEEKRERHKQTYDPARAAIYRQKRMPYHVEYCRRPEYREKKKAYDRPHRAKKLYGDLWEVFILTQDIRSAVLERQSDYEIRLSKGTLSKSQKRKRAYDQIERARPHREVPQVGPMVNLERGERR